MRLGGVVLTLTASCSKDNQVTDVAIKEPNINETISKMVQITNQQTTAVKNQIASFDAQGVKMTTEQYNGFVRNTIETYVTKLVESQPEYLENDGLQINKEDTENWDGHPDVYGGDAETVLPPHMLSRFDKLAIRLDAIAENPMYELEANQNAGAAEIQNVLQGELADINNDIGLTTDEKLMLTEAVMAAGALVMPQLGFLKALAQGAETLGEDMENFRRRGFWGRLIRAVARVAIAIITVAVTTFLVVKTFGLLGAKFATLYKAPGLAKKLLFGVSKKTGGASKTLKWYGALTLGGAPAVIKAVDKWDTDLSLKYWYKEVVFKAKASY